MKFLVYGTLKKAFGNHRILERGKAEFIGAAITQDSFVMTGYGVPFVWPHEDGYPLLGEVYDIGDLSDMNARRTLADLDRLEGNGFVYERKEHVVRIVGSDDVHTVWIYEAMAHYREAPKPDHPHVTHWLNGDGVLEWSVTRLREFNMERN